MPMIVCMYENFCFATFIGLAFNFLLLWLINNKTPSGLRSYARIMRIHCIADILYDLAVDIGGIHMVPLNGKLFMVVEGLFPRADLRITRFLYSSVLWINLGSIAILPIEFYYRYRTLCKNTDMTNRQLYAYVFIAYAITWIHAFPASLSWLTIGPTNETQALTDELASVPRFKGLEIPSYAVIVLGTAQSTFNLIYILALNIFAYVVIIVTTFKITRRLKGAADEYRSTRTREIRKQVTRILILQAIIPLLILSIPMSIAATLALCRISFTNAGEMNLAVVCWLSALKPIATIFIVPKYRQIVVKKAMGDIEPSSTSYSKTHPSIPSREISAIRANGNGDQQKTSLP